MTWPTETVRSVTGHTSAVTAVRHFNEIEPQAHHLSLASWSIPAIVGSCFTCSGSLHTSIRTHPESSSFCISASGRNGSHVNVCPFHGIESARRRADATATFLGQKFGSHTSKANGEDIIFYHNNVDISNRLIILCIHWIFKSPVY